MKNGGHEIGIIIDGIYCPKCRELHPTLFWHEKYDDYKDTKPEEVWIKEHIMRARVYGFNCTKEQARLLYREEKRRSPVCRMEKAGKCAVCAYPTRFIHKATGRFVCSDECRYEDHPNPLSLFHPLDDTGETFVESLRKKRKRNMDGPKR